MNKRVWSWPLAIYLFLGGLGAGMTIVAASADIFFGKGEPFGPCLLVAAIALALGAGFLLFELGVRTGFWRVFTWHGAVLNFGAYSLGVLIVLDLVYFGFFVSWVPWYGALQARFVFAVLSLVVGIGVIVYTGVELSSMKGRVFWNTPALPVLFAVSGLLTGAAADSLTLGMQLSGPAVEAAMQAQTALAALGAALAVLTLLCVLSYVLMMHSSSNVHAQVPAVRILKGSYAGVFWAGLVAVGLVLPVVLYIVGGVVWLCLANCCVLVGGICLRFLFVFSDDRCKLPGEDDYYETLAHGDEPFMKTDWT